MQKPVTIKTIATEMGLSLSAVSKALNDYPDISCETKKAVLDKSQEMGYTPNLLARNLVKNTSNSIGVIVRDISIVYGELFKPLSLAARKHNLNLIVADSNRDVEEENRCLQTMIESRVKGVIIAPVNGDYKRIKQIISDRIPIVFLGNAITQPDLCYVATDSRMGTTLAMEFLYRKGHRDIALIGDAKQSNSTTTKIETYKKFMVSNNLVPAVFKDSSQINSLIDAGYQQTNKMLSVKRNFTAVYAIKDDVAIGVMKALNEAGKRIPQDISVIGYDGSEVSANPLIELTTVAWDMGDITEKLVNMIISQSEKLIGAKPEHYLAKPYVMERKSCGVPQMKNK